MAAAVGVDMDGALTFAEWITRRPEGGVIASQPLSVAS